MTDSERPTGEPSAALVAECVRCERAIPVGKEFPSALCICSDCLASEKAPALDVEQLAREWADDNEPESTMVYLDSHKTLIMQVAELPTILASFGRYVLAKQKEAEGGK